jgi:hypothetical protein
MKNKGKTLAVLGFICIIAIVGFFIGRGFSDTTANNNDSCKIAAQQADKIIHQQSEVISISGDVVGTNVPAIINAVVAFDADSLAEQTNQLQQANENISNVANTIDWGAYKSAKKACGL